MDFKCVFSPGNWQQNDFLTAVSPRWQKHSSWVQLDDCITNAVADDIDPYNLYENGTDRSGEIYISMLNKQPLRGNVRVETVCAFEERMAPLIVFSTELTPILHEHLEVVLFDQGINLWHHFFHDGKPSWKLIGYLNLDLKANEKHRLVAELRFTGRGTFIFMGVDEPQFGCRLADNWPQECYAGITACEGRNRFYSFEVSGLNGVTNERN